MNKAAVSTADSARIRWREPVAEELDGLFKAKRMRGVKGQSDRGLSPL